MKRTSKKSVKINN